MICLDIPLPYGNTLLFLSDGASHFVRLVMIVDGRRTCVTPALPIEMCAIRDLLSITYAEFELGPIRLATEPKYLIVHRGFHHLPVEHSEWKPLMADWLAKTSSTTM